MTKPAKVTIDMPGVGRAVLRFHGEDSKRITMRVGLGRNAHEREFDDKNEAVAAAVSKLIDAITGAL